MKNSSLRHLFFYFLAFFFSLSLFAQTNQNALYEQVLIGTKEGLFQVNNYQTQRLWAEAGIHKIIYTDRYYFLTTKGVYESKDLQSFTSKNTGLPAHSVKTIENGEKIFSLLNVDLKDLASHPTKPEILVTATKDAVYISRDSAESWKSLGSSARTAGCKSVAVCDLPRYNSSGAITGSELIVFMSHPIYGLSYIQADSANPKWIDITRGFDSLPNNPLVDEIADILPVVSIDANGNQTIDVFLSQSFIPRLYSLDWKNKKAVPLWKGALVNASFDSLVYENGALHFLEMGGFSTLNIAESKIQKNTAQTNQWFQSIRNQNLIAEAAFFKHSNDPSRSVSLDELWMLYPNTIASSYSYKASGKKSLYLPVNQITGASLQKHIQTLVDNKLNSVVVDMKDDYGMLRYKSTKPSIIEKNGISRHAIDLEDFVNPLKEKDIYLIARIVVFKDKNLYQWQGGKYAVWDSALKKPWQGIRGYSDILDENEIKTGTQTNYYDEFWVDPYSDEVWEYNVAIAQELIERGFDEIQFDYIRFPTDGLNLSNASYRHHEKDMDKESALLSFLKYARSNIQAPIGIDIYGANGWYRSGARTGQDVELMAPYVDVICPMFYPSHFEQNFLDYKPAAERPYRIYYFGSYRNAVIARNQIIVRPWLQAFYLGVSYDKLYYDKNYVKRQVFGVRDSIHNGYMYWNNSGRYDDIEPDIDDDEAYPWTY
jgi:hypothetical protein